MPYISEKLKKYIDHEINEIIATVHQHDDLWDKRDGIANYVITRLVLGILRPSEGWNYSSLSEAIKTLECAKLEIYRRMLALYEDVAIAKNGDVFEFDRFDKELATKLDQDLEAGYQTLIKSVFKEKKSC